MTGLRRPHSRRLSNPSKRKGTAWETAVVRYLQGRGLDAHRKPQTGRIDTGDVDVEEFVVLEAKDVGTITLAAFLDQANAEAQAAHRDYGAAVIKRRRRPVQDAYVVMDLATFASLVGWAQWVRVRRHGREVLRRARAATLGTPPADHEETDAPD